MHTQQTPNTTSATEPITQYVGAPNIAKIYTITSRYVLQMAAEGRIPCIRIGKKCVRFNPAAVAAAVEKSKI